MSNDNETYIFSLKGIIAILRAFFVRGANLFTILEIRTNLNPLKLALVADGKSFRYIDLYSETKKLAYVLKEEHKLKAGQKIAILCRNNVEHILSIFAASGIGMDVFLLSAEISEEQFQSILNRRKFDFIIHDPSLSRHIEKNGYTDKSLVTTNIRKLEFGVPETFRLKRVSFNKIVVLTSGSTGNSAEAGRNTAFFTYIKPFRSLLRKLHITTHKSLYIATPLHHGFGLISLLISIAMGKLIFIQSTFNESRACELIKNHKIEAITLVPLMLRRMLYHSKESLQSLRCIISGGAALSPQLVVEVQHYLGDVLYNLYGTSETSVILIASPSDLKYSPECLGKVLDGVKIRIVNSEKNKVDIEATGEIEVKCAWSVNPNQWINTGDIGYVDTNGYYFLKGRSDDMIVSGGENVYPLELENILSKHPCILEVVVIGITDDEFGQRLKAFIVVDNTTSITEYELFAWLKEHTARYQMPKEIEFVKEIPLNKAGKPDKKKLMN